MKKLIIAISVCLFGLTATAEKKLPVLIDNSVYDIMKVQFTDTATILTMRVNSKYETDALIGTPYLRKEGVKQGFKFRHGHIKDKDKTPLATSQKIEPGQEVMMYFDPLPKNTKEISYIEHAENYSNQRLQIGIRADRRKYRGSSFPEPNYSPREHLPAFEAKVDSSYLSAEMNMPNITFSWSSMSSQWSDESMGYKPNIDSLSNVDIAYINMLPSSMNMQINGISLPWLSVPGNKTRIIFDAPGYAAMIAEGADKNEACLKSFKIYDAPVPEFYTTRKYPNYKWNGAKTEWLSLPFETYIDSISRKMEGISQEIEAIENLSGAEREFLHILNEKFYVGNRSLYYLVNRDKLSDEEKEFFNSAESKIDKKAASFYSAKSPGAIYVFGTDAIGMVNFLKANGLKNAPLCKIMDNYQSAVDSIASARCQLKEDDLLGIRSIPDCPYPEILDSIVASHKGKTVFVDYWNTWCGPCMKGMEEMEKYKEDLIKKGVEFVYIADESSPDKAWRKMIEKHKGNHYLILSKVIKEMKLPGFEGSIPFYMIFRPDGTLHYTQSGWSGPEVLLEKIEEANPVVSE